MLVLLAAEMNSTRGLGPVAAIGVAVALVAMMTLFPALLVIFGRWIFWPVIPHFGSADPTERGVWARMGGRIARRPRMIWGVTAAALALLSLGLIQLRAEGISNADAFTGKPDSIVGQEVSARYFPAGSGDPLVIVSNRAQAEEVGQAVAATSRCRTGLPRPATGHETRVRGQGPLRGDHDRRPRTARPRNRRWSGSGTPCTRSPTPTPRWAAAPRPCSTWTRRRPTTTS